MDCHLCDKTFGQPSSFYRHLREVHLVEKKAERLKCSLCPKTFSRVDHLRRHLQTSHGEQLGISSRMYECPVCKVKTFKRRDHLQVHLRKCPEQKQPVNHGRKQTERMEEENIPSHELFDLLQEFFNNITSVELFQIMCNL